MNSWSNSVAPTRQQIMHQTRRAPMEILERCKSIEISITTTVIKSLLSYQTERTNRHVVWWKRWSNGFTVAARECRREFSAQSRVTIVIGTSSRARATFFVASSLAMVSLPSSPMQSLKIMALYHIQCDCWVSAFLLTRHPSKFRVEFRVD